MVKVFFNKTNEKNPHATSSIVLGCVRIVIRIAQIPGRSAEFAKKWRVDLSRRFGRDFAERQNFKWLKNREDGSDFNDSWTKSTTSFRTVF